MPARRKAFFAEKKEPEKCGFEEEREHTFHGERLADDAAGCARELGPVGAELKLHGDACDHAEQKVERENSRPEPRGLVVALVFCAQGCGLEYNDEQGKAHGELRKKIVEGDGEAEVNAMKYECRHGEAP